MNRRFEGKIILVAAHSECRLLFASDDSRYITGSELFVDGGVTQV